MFFVHMYSSLVLHNTAPMFGYDHFGFSDIDRVPRVQRRLSRFKYAKIDLHKFLVWYLRAAGPKQVRGNLSGLNGRNNFKDFISWDARYAARL